MHSQGPAFGQHQAAAMAGQELPEEQRGQGQQGQEERVEQEEQQAILLRQEAYQDSRR